MQSKQYRAYANATQTVAKTRQIIMLYDAAIRNLQQAKEAMAGKRIEERFRKLTRAAEIIFGLQGCLDFEKGGEVAKILYDFYASLDARLLHLHRTESIEMCEQLIRELKSMREVWDDIDQGSSEDAAMPLLSQPEEAASGRTLSA